MGAINFGKEGAFSIDLRDWSGGLNDRDDPREIADNELQIARNAMWNRRGAIEKRTGYDVVAERDEATGGVRGLLPFPLMNGTKKLVLFHGGEVFSFAPDDFSWGEKKGDYGTDDGEPVGGIIFQNLAIFSNGKSGGNLKKWNGTDAVANLGGSPPVNTNILSKIDELLLLVKDNRVYWCAPSLPEDYAVENKAGYQAISSEDGEFLTALIAHGSGLVAFTDIGKRGVSVNYDETNVSIGLATNEIVDRSDGAIGGRTATAVRGGGIFFLSEDGFKSFGVDADSPLMRTSRGLSEKTPKIIRKINCAKIEKATAIAWKDLIFCALPLDFASENNAVMVYDPVFRGWGIWEMPIGDFAIFENAAGERNLYFGHSREPKLCRMNRQYADDVGGDAREIDFEIVTKSFSPSPKNKWETLTVWGDITRGATVEILVTIDRKTKSLTLGSEDITEKYEDDSIFTAAVWGDVWNGKPTNAEQGERFFQVKKKFAVSEIAKEMNEGAEWSLGIRNANLNESFRLRRVLMQGRVLEGAY